MISSEKSATFPDHVLGVRAAIERGKRRIDGAPAGRADLAIDQNATLGKYEIRTTAATFVLFRVVLISRGGLCQFLLIFGLVILGFGSRCAAAGRGGGDNAHRLDKSPPRCSGSRHGCSSFAPWLN
jgi:hypothetical protein